MIIILATLLILLILALSFLLGYYIGKGNITINKKLSKQEKEAMAKSEKEFKEMQDRFNEGLKEVVNYSDEGY